MTTADLLGTLAVTLTGAAGKTAGHWMRVLGDLTTYPLSTHPRCNWSINPRGSADDVADAHLAINLAREQHPYVDNRAEGSEA